MNDLATLADSPEPGGFFATVRSEAHTSGRPVMGYLGDDVPTELLRAAGFQPMPLVSRHGVPRRVSELFDGGFDSPLRDVLERLVDGEYGELAGVVMSKETDEMNRAFHHLSEAVHLGLVDIPRVHLVGLVHQGTGPSQHYNACQIRGLVNVLGRWSGRPVGEDAIGEAIIDGNRRRDALSEIDDARRAPVPLVSGTAHAVATLTWQLGLAKSPGVTAGARGSVAAGEARIYLTGSAQSSPEVHALVERAYGPVVGDDVLSAHLHRSVPTHVAPEDGIVHHYGERTRTSSAALTRDRVEAMRVDVASSAADTVVMVIRPDDPLAGWDVPLQSAAVDAAGLLLVRVDAEDLQSRVGQGDMR